MVKFEFIKDKIQITPTIILFREFRNILIWGEKSGKHNKLFKYIYHYCDLDPSNPTAAYPPSERDGDAKFRAFHDTDYKFPKKEKELVEAAVKRYIRCNSSASIRTLNRFDKKTEQLIELLNDTQPDVVENVKDGVTSYVSNVPIITGALTELDDIRKRRLMVIASIRSQAITTRVRGKLNLSPLSKGMLKIPTNEISTSELRGIQEKAKDIESSRS